MMPTSIQILHDQLVSHKDFQKGQRVLLYDSKLHIFQGKLKSRWIGPFTIRQVHSNGVVEQLQQHWELQSEWPPSQALCGTFFSRQGGIHPP